MPLTPEQREEVKSTTFTVPVTYDVTVPHGFGVWFSPIFEGWVETDDGYSYESDRVVDVDAGIVEISPDTVSVVRGEALVEAEEGYVFSVSDFIDGENFHPEHVDDTHDLRNCRFKTREDAEHHLNWTLERFRNPLPWETFVRTT